MSHEIDEISNESVGNSQERNYDEHNHIFSFENVIHTEAHTSAEREMFHFSSDDSHADPDYQHSDSDSNDSSKEQVLSLTNTAQSVYSRKISKERRNKGQIYINRKGRTVAQRNFRPFDSDCRMKCKFKVPETLQKEYFDIYWALGTYNQRILFIGGLIDIEDIKTKRLQKHAQKPRQRNSHVKYHLEYDNRRVQICQKCFKQCFDETESFLKSVKNRKINFPNGGFSEKRGSGAGTNKLSENDIQNIKAHINTFPKYESHYTRRDTSCMYFHSDLSLTQMYKLYCDENESRAVSITSYSNIFKTMNIKFKKPKIDTCHTCDKLKAKIDIAKQENNTASLKDSENELSLHHNKAELAYQSKRVDKDMGTKDLTIKTYAFDLQQCLPTPFLKTSISFYKRQLWTYNLTVHDCNTGTPYCYMWHEALSGRGGNNIASCLFKHISSLRQLKHVIFYSDSCVGQNKNSFVCAMFVLAFEVNENLETIDHKFLEPGHTHMECDVDHAVIERKKKKTSAQIHHPHDWYNFVRFAGVKNKFNVVEMSEDDFFNFSLFLKTKFMWRAANENGEKFIWKNVKWLRFKRTNFGKILYKTSLKEEEPFKILNILKRGVCSVNVNDVPKLTEEVKIDAKKKKDLEDLLPFINPCFHSFYKTLRTNETPIDIHPDLVEHDSDEE